MVEWLAGRLQRALEHAVAADELADQTQYPHRRGWAGRVKALIEADLGLVEQAAPRPRKGSRGHRRARDEIFTIVSLRRARSSRARTWQPRGCRRLPARAAGAVARGGLDRPDGPCLADSIETLVALGELELAGAYLEQFELHARRLGSPWAIAAAARCRACSAPRRATSTARSPPSSGALTELDDASLPARAWPHAALSRHGTQASGAKKAAREALEQALAIFEELGARLWAEKARASSGGSAGGEPASDELTETERARRRARSAGPLEQGDRRRAVHGREHGRDAPFPRLPQAWRPARRACRPPCHSWTRPQRCDCDARGGHRPRR